MTESVYPTTPLLTLDRLALWAQERPLLDPEFGDLIIEAVSNLLRQFGSPLWDATNLPARARDIGYVVAKDYYLNPRQLRQETTGPLQESVNDTVLNGINLTEDQKAELAGMVTEEGGSGINGLWMMSFYRGSESTIHDSRKSGSVIIYDEREGWPIEYLNTEDSVVFLPPEA